MIHAMIFIAVSGLLFTLTRYLSIERINDLARTPLAIEIDEDTPPELIFARAQALDTTEPLESIRLYGLAKPLADSRLKAVINYNLGSLYLREAARLWKKSGLSEYIRINTLLAVAKDNLREALILDPTNWAARFNLEYAERITPPPKERPKNDFQGNKGSVFATLPSIPGGGP